MLAANMPAQSFMRQLYVYGAMWLILTSPDASARHTLDQLGPSHLSSGRAPVPMPSEDRRVRQVLKRGPFDLFQRAPF